MANKTQSPKMTSILRAPFLNSKLLFLYNWKGYGKEAEEVANQIKSLFMPIEVVTALVYNITFFNIVSYILLTLAGFSREFRHFTLLYVTFPGEFGSLLYYSYRFGLSSLLKHSWTSITAYMHNFSVVLALSLTPLLLSIVSCLAASRYLEPLLPQSLQSGFTFPLKTWEKSLKEQVFIEWIWCFLLLISIPVWNRAYHANLEILGRKGVLTYAETAIEIIFVTCQSYTLHFLYVPLVIILRNHGIMFHPVHVFVAITEIVFLNRILNVKFFNSHKLGHESKEIYRMTHIEHHLCKGVYVTTTGVGVWESLSLAGTPGICLAAFLSVPYAVFQGLYMGVNFVAHLMTPCSKFIQWHHLHHIVSSDMYGSNIPTPEDRENSKIYTKYAEKLQHESLFVRYEWLSDAFGILCTVIGGLVLHFVFGTGIIKAYDDIQWNEN